MTAIHNTVDSVKKDIPTTNKDLEPSEAYTKDKDVVWRDEFEFIRRAVIRHGFGNWRLIKQYKFLNKLSEETLENLIRTMVGQHDLREYSKLNVDLRVIEALNTIRRPWPKAPTDRTSKEKELAFLGKRIEINQRTLDCEPSYTKHIKVDLESVVSERKRRQDNKQRKEEYFRLVALHRKAWALEKTRGKHHPLYGPGDIVERYTENLSREGLGKIVDLNSDGTYKVNFENNIVEQSMDEEEVILRTQCFTYSNKEDFKREIFEKLEFCAGDKVLACSPTTSAWMVGIIASFKKKQNCYDILFQNGALEKDIYLAQIEPYTEENAKVVSNTTHVEEDANSSQFILGLCTNALLQHQYEVMFFDSQNPDDKIEYRLHQRVLTKQGQATIMDKHIIGENQCVYVLMFDSGIIMSDIDPRFLRPNRPSFLRALASLPDLVEKSDKKLNVDEDNNKQTHNDKIPHNRVFSVGQRVMPSGRPDLGGLVTLLKDDGRCLVCFDDNRQRLMEHAYLRSLRRPPSFFIVGDRVEAQYSSRGGWYAGTVTGCDSGKYFVRYDDDDTESSGTSATFMRLLVQAELNVRDLHPKPVIGDRIEANFLRAGFWYKGVISGVGDARTYSVTYDDENVEVGVLERNIRLITANDSSEDIASCAYFPQKGDLVEGNFKMTGNWCQGIVSSISRLGKYTVVYNTGEQESDLDDTQVRRLANKPQSKYPSFDVGARVDFEYGQANGWASGEIIKIHHNGKYNVKRDSGQIVFRVRKLSVRAAVKTLTEKDSLEVGTCIEGNFEQKGIWYSGKVVALNPDGTCSVHYDDGDEEQNVSRSNLRLVIPRSLETKGRSCIQQVALKADEIKLNCRVQGNFEGQGEWYDGCITKLNEDGTFNIYYDDGDKEEGVTIECLRPVLKSDAKSRKAGKTTSLRNENITLGTRVQGNFANEGEWYNGSVAKVNGDGTYNINYDDGDKEESVAMKSIRLMKQPNSRKRKAVRNSSQKTGVITVGTRVEGNFGRQGSWYPGYVSNVNSKGRFSVDYDDGDSENNVTRNNLRVLHESIEAKSLKRSKLIENPKRDELSVGSKVSANFRREGEWYEGTITDINSNGTFNIAYADGDVENSVTLKHLRLYKDLGPTKK